MSSELSIVAGVSLALLALPAFAASAYLGALAFFSRRPPTPTRDSSTQRLTFDVIVPAHDEESGIAATVTSLCALDYPRDQFRVIVVADNCSDGTAVIARDAGALVLERHDAQHRGKGHALAFAFAMSHEEGFADAIVVVDADTVASPNLLTAFAARFESGEVALQALYGVRNVVDSWRTRLLSIAFALFHDVRSLGRERLGLSCGLRGNGMAFTRDLLKRVPYRAFSIVEDIEYGLALGRLGIRVGYVANARVDGEMPGSESASRSQRDRWEDGRKALVRQYAASMLRASLASRDRVQFDLAADLLVPPLAQLVLAVALGTMLSALALSLGIGAALPAVVLWSTSVVALALYVVRGCVLSGSGPRVILDLLWAPVYIAWKVARLLRPRRATPTEWVRTSRVTEP